MYAAIKTILKDSRCLKPYKIVYMGGVSFQSGIIFYHLIASADMTIGSHIASQYHAQPVFFTGNYSAMSSIQP